MCTVCSLVRGQAVSGMVDSARKAWAHTQLSQLAVGIFLSGKEATPSHCLHMEICMFISPSVRHSPCT